jgi:hypothetical protein
MNAMARVRRWLSRFKSRDATPNLVVQHHAGTQSWTFQCLHGYESRNASTLHLLTMAMQSLKGQLKNSFSIPIWTSDFVSPAPASRHFAYCKSAEQSTTTAIPDHLFWAWPEVGIPDYEQMVDHILSASQKPADDPRLFWVGNLATHPTRHTLISMAAADARINAVGMTWAAGSASKSFTASDASQYVSLPDHCRYRYLIDLQGNGYSGRLKLLLFSGRPVFIQARRWQEYFFSDLQPFVHFIPVAEDLSDLGERLTWADSHPDEAEAIARHAQGFALNHLRRQHAVAELERCLLAL